MPFFSKDKRIYLDWASAAPVKEEAMDAFNTAIGLFGNPSSPHTEGVRALRILENARTTIARLAKVKSEAVVFTSGATEANNLAIQGRIEKCREQGMEYKDMHVLYLPTMHSSVLKTIQEIAKEGVQVEALPLMSEEAGFGIDMDAVAKLLRPSTILIAADVVCGETGIRFDVLRLRRAIDAAKLAHTCALLVDASQLPLVEPIDITRLGADVLTLDAQKVGGIRGVGALIMAKVSSHPFIASISYGGGQENGLRPGTEPVALIAAFAAALSKCATEYEAFAVGAAEGRTHLIHAIKAEFKDMHINEGKPKSQSSHILNLSFPGIDTDYAVMLLDAKGIAVSTKSACETDSADGSKTILALTNDEARARSTLRISWGPKTTAQDLWKLQENLISTIRFLHANAI